ncbi:polysaccharide pyruvyl transferase family protein [Pelagovum pacificum]|uniref:Polysaccharide pyruvyl transferase family protein n=1 Tax=Pelagovum pacificum TaxID=2588711 RepID=A0A5C5GBK2_9RHOB|nr:polysaccharide pyruvyl transferase family protein [Pelagovum pacificum]QQA42256.1 polysaccharide pyruvyl transferase family protein [Pelagovum pacificum]TNY31340.1 polysaccharide pyruvyl transferase family protein [Pelagovum pacificum]
MAKQEPLRLSWWSGRPNFGDALSPLVVSHVSGREVILGDRSEVDLFAVGSIMIRARRGYNQPQENRPTIWGTGMMGPHKTDFVDNVDFAAVRGPITASLLGLGQLPFGDPGLILSELAKTEVERGDRVGVIPHHGDFKDPQTKGQIAALPWSDDFVLIDPRNDDPLDVADQIQACRHVFSASLHGLIIADAFGVPNTWVAGREIHSTASFKFLDYFLSVGRTYQAPIGFADIVDAEKSVRSISALGYADGVASSRQALIDAFPERLKAA